MLCVVCASSAALVLRLLSWLVGLLLTEADMGPLVVNLAKHRGLAVPDIWVPVTDTMTPLNVDNEHAAPVSALGKQWLVSILGRCSHWISSG